MQTKYIKYFKQALLLTSMCLVLAGILLTSCKKEEGDNGVTVLNSFGPMPVARGAELRFIGKNLDKVTEIDLPGNIVISAADFGTKTATLITITVPQNAVEGTITIKAPEGDIITKTAMGFSEPISIASFAPATIKPGAVLTITGDYLNLVKQVIFTDRVVMPIDSFITKSRSQITLKVPAAAQTGKISVSNGATDPIIVYSANALTVMLPTFATSSAISPNPVKAGTQITITGTNLDLVKQVVFGGNVIVRDTAKTNANFSKSPTQITLKVPDNAQDGNVTLIPMSGIKIISSSALEMVVPTVSVAPTTVKNGADVTITGTDLDLIDKVTFGGNKQGAIKAGGTAAQILVTVPDDAISGVVTFTTKANKTVDGSLITIVDPVFTSFAPTSSKAKADIVISGTDLDLVTAVSFVGGVNGTIGARTATSLTVTVPVGAKTGKITLTAKNGNKVISSTDFTALANLPSITSFTEASGVRGKILTINGTNMDLIKQLVFPGNVKATDYGVKSSTKVEVYVPDNAVTGYGTIKLFTYEGEEGLSPDIFISGVDPVKNQTLCFFDFNGTGKDSWWGNAMSSGTLTDANQSADGTSFWRVNGMSGTGYWDGLFFRNGSNNFVTTGVDVNTWAVRFDINVLETISEGSLSIRFGDYYYSFQPWVGMTGGFKTIGWITVTCPLTGFKNGGTVLTDPSVGGQEFGMIWRTGNSVKVNMSIDNIRFEPIP